MAKLLPTIGGIPVDPTGAGDRHGATFVSAWLEGLDPATAFRYASTSGARAATRQGPMEVASSRAGPHRFLADFEGIRR